MFGRSALRSLNSKLSMLLFVMVAFHWTEPASLSLAPMTSSLFVSAHQTIEDEDSVPLSGDGEQATPQAEPAADASSALGGIDIPNSGLDRKGIMDKIKEFFSHEPMWYYVHYKFELGCLVIVFIILCQFFYGKEQNVALVENWQKRCAARLISEFEHVGITKDLKSYSVMQLSYSRFDFFASARKNVLYAEFKLNLIRRQCFVTNHIYDRAMGTVDNLVLEMPLDPNNNGKCDLPLEFFMCRIRDVAARKKEIKSLGDGMISQVGCKHFQLTGAQLKQKNNLQIFAEHSEIAGSLIDQYLGQAFLTLGASGMLHELHITDLGTYSSHPLVLRAVIQLPSDANDTDAFEKVSSIIMICLYFADRVATLRLSSNVRDKLEKSRKKLRAEALAKVREEHEEKMLE